MGLVEQKLGELLKLERERRKISIDEISTDIKIPAANLEGIESGDLSLLPSPVYYNLFCRTYCQALGIDHSRTLEAIKEEVSQETKKGEKPKIIQKPAESDQPEQSRAQLLNLSTPIKKLIGAAAILVIVFLAYISIEKLFFRDGVNSSNTAEMLKGVDAERINSLAGFNWETPTYKSPSEIKIDIKPRTESWGTVMSDGDTVIFRRLLPGKVYSASAKYRLVVSIGVPQAVDVEINGRLVDLRDKENQRISRVEVNQANLESFLNPSFDNLVPPDSESLIQGALGPDTLKKVSISGTGNAVTDTASATTN